MDRNMYTEGIPLVPLVQDREKNKQNEG